MISFRETVEVVERQTELLRSAEDVDKAVESALTALKDYRQMLEFSHMKDFATPGEALIYIDKVLIPQLNTIRDSLSTSTEAPLKRLQMASDQTQRLMLQLRMFTEGAQDLIP